jgi:type I restriction enzyme S subunit
MLTQIAIHKLQDILFRHVDTKEYSFFIFGSRSVGNNKKYSDIDIGIEGKKPLSFGIIAKLEEDFENSDLPYTVDIVDFTTVTSRFRTSAKKNIISIN